MDQPTGQAVMAFVYLLAKIAKASDCDLSKLSAELNDDLADLPPSFSDGHAGVVLRKFLALIEKDVPST